MVCTFKYYLNITTVLKRKDDKLYCLPVSKFYNLLAPYIIISYVVFERNKTLRYDTGMIRVLYG